ncbi:MAG: hypothetical protein QNJ58_13945 [Desulfobacterales bacterium]|nr:hypothetical protein [Desulfobacterales bacterium]
MTKKLAHLLETGIVDEEDLRKASEIAESAGQSVEAALINYFAVSKRDIGESLSIFYDCQFIAFDPEMPIATEMFHDLDKSLLLNDCWVPISWDQKGIVVLVSDPFDPDLRAIIETVFESCPIFYAVGIKEDIECFISLSFVQLAIDKVFYDADCSESHCDITAVVDDVLICL